MATFEGEFLFDNQLISKVENLIKNSKKHLLLISPYIDLDKRIQDALLQKKSQYDFELLLLFGKNEDNCYKSIKKDSLEFLKQFPNIEIRYNDRLHAKFYQNDFDWIVTSLNLYDYSLAKNIEVGFSCNYAAKGLIGKVINSTDSLINQGYEKVRQDVLGYEKDVDIIEKFRQIFESSELKYKTEPIIEEKSGFKGMIGGKKLNGFKVIEDNLNADANKNFIKPEAPNKSSSPIVNSSNGFKVVSASQLSKTFGVPQSEITNLMAKHGFINGDSITSVGISKGLSLKSYMGREYIAYPENLPELTELKK